jgi:hypothetical protein
MCIVKALLSISILKKSKTLHLGNHCEIIIALVKITSLNRKIDMELITAVEILELHQRWRKGAEIEMILPSILSEAIDVILEYLKNLNN